VEKLVVMAILSILAVLAFYGFQVARHSADGIAADAEAVLAKLDHKTPPPLKGSAPTPIADQHIFVLHAHVADVDAEIQRLSAVASFKVLHKYTQAFKGFAAQATPENHALLRQDAAVHGAEQDHTISIRAQQASTGVRRANVNLGYNGTLFGVPAPASKPAAQQISVWSNVTVAVMDTGIDATHPELNVVSAHGFLNGNASDVADLHGHGTHVSGIIGAFNNTIGVVGVAPGVRLYNLKILDANGAGTFSDMLAALNFVHANANQIHVLNLSVGGPFSPVINHAVTQCVQAGVVVAVAAGNDGQPASLFSPASAPGAIAVGALADSDGKPGRLGPNTGFGQDDSFATFSNYGPVVKVVAPGVKIASTWPISKGGYAILSGTSMASPHVAGMAARIQNAALNPSAPGASVFFKNRPAARATPAEVLHVLRQNATEKINGRFDALQYPVLNAKGL
jgi:subtilisin family serine protease